MNQSDFNYTLLPLPDHGFFWATFSGEISMGRLARAHAALTDHPDYSSGMNELLDFSQASIKQMTTKEIEEIRSYMVKREDRHHSRSVIVVSSQVEFGLGRMMGALMDRDVPVDRWICYSVEDALEWLHPGKVNELLEGYQHGLAKIG